MNAKSRKLWCLLLSLILLVSLFPTVYAEVVIGEESGESVQEQILIPEEPSELPVAEELEEDPVPEEFPVEEPVSPEEPVDILPQEPDLQEEDLSSPEKQTEEAEEEPEEEKESVEEDLPEVLHLSLDFRFEGDNDNNSLLDAYAEQQLNSAKVSRRMFRAAPNETRGLNSSQTYAYYILKDCILRTASGALSSTAYEVEYGEYGLWTAEELGYERFTAANVMEALESVIDLNTMLRALISACPYELYWFDKTVGIHTDIVAAPTAREIRLSRITYYFAVAGEYQAGNYLVDTTQAERISEAVQTARDIVAEASGLSDYEKLRYYNQRICALTEYNYPASRGAAYGNPWQMIWVFDGDKNTTVVCEGYAKAYQYLCDLSSFNSSQVYCICATGNMSGERHMWNIVSMDDGRNYLVDVTNNDSGASAGENLFLKGYYSGDLNSGYRFRAGRGNMVYVYDSDTLSWFGTELLTLSPENYGTEHVHTPGQPVQENTLEASCTEGGKYESVIYCLKCGEEISRNSFVIPATGHHSVLRNQKNASYDEEGYTGDQICSVCGELLETGEVIPKLIYTPKAISVVLMLSDGTDVTGKTIFYDINQSETFSINASCLPENASQGVTWTVSDQNGIYADYTVTGSRLTIGNGRKLGSVTLTAAATDGSRKNARVSIRFVRFASSIHILENNDFVFYDGMAALTAGQSVSLKTDIAADRDLSDRNVIWSIDSSAVSINSSGRLSVGNISSPETVTVTAQVKARPEISDSFRFTVYPAPVSVQLSLNGNPASGSQTLGVGQSVTISASLLPAEAMQGGIWTISNPSVLRLDSEAGTLTGLSPGNATLSFRSGRLSARLSLKVVKPVESVEVKLQNGSVPLLAGKTLQLTATVLPSDATLKTVLWKSSDDSIATVNASGRVTAKAVSSRRTVNITALAADNSGVLGSYTLTLIPAVSALQISDGGAIVSGTVITARIDEQLPLKALVSPADAEQSVSWKSSNLRVAEVDGNGIVTIKNRGSVRITASAVDGSRKTANVTIKIS